eukprot:3706197-Prymnesium_polylepis.1
MKGGGRWMGKRDPSRSLRARTPSCRPTRGIGPRCSWGTRCSTVESLCPARSVESAPHVRARASGQHEGERCR